MKSKLEQYKQELSELMETKNDPNTPSDIKEAIAPAIEKLKSLIKDEEAKVDKTKPKKESKPKSALKKVQEKIGAKKKQPEKKSEPAKKSLTALDRCREIIAKYNDKKKADAQRVKKRIRAGKPVELTAGETIKKAASKVRAKVVEMDRGLKASEETSIISGIVKSVVSAMAGIKEPNRKKEFLSKIIESLSKLNKNIKLRADDGMYVEDSIEFIEDAGGEMENDMAETIRKNIISVRHHTDEILASLKQNPELEHWLINRTSRAATDLSDVAHFLDGSVNKMAKGGQIPTKRGQIVMIADPMEDENPNQLYMVVEDHMDEYPNENDRILVSALGTGMSIPPTMRIEKNQLVVVDEGDKEYMAKGGTTNYLKKWSVKYIAFQGKSGEKIITLGRMSTPQDVKNALRRMYDTNIREVTSITEINEDGGMMADGGELNKEEILSKTIVYDNGGKSMDRYTVFTPDGSVFGMSDNATGFNQYVGESDEIPKGSHLGKKLKSVPKEIEWAVIDRMTYEKGGMMAKGGIYSSENLYILKVFNTNTGELLDMSKRVWAKNLNQAERIAMEDFESDMKQKYGDYLRFRVEEAPSMMAKGGYNYGRSWHLDRARHNKSEDYEVRAKGRKMAKGGEVKVGDIIEAKTGVKVKVIAFDPKFGGRVRVERMDEYATGKPSQWVPLKNFNFAEGGINDDSSELNWQNADYGDSALVVSENKMGVIVKAYGRKFHLKFVDGTEKTYDASELKFYNLDSDEEFAKGGYNYGRSWHLDRARHNKSEDYEVRAKGRKMAKGGETKGMKKYPSLENMKPEIIK